MKKLLYISFLILFSYAKGQDSTKKMLNHELGFNTVGLIRQAINSNPSNTLTQSPYLLIYNLYYKDLIGLRLGLGLSTANFETSIVGQNLPRTTKRSDLNLRTGVTYNFLVKEKFAFNTFADLVISSSKNETTNTATVQAFPNPIENITTLTSNETKGIGGGVGFGVKYNFNKHISVYAETGYYFVSSKATSLVTITDATSVDRTEETTESVGSNLILPTTLYLIIRF